MSPSGTLNRPPPHVYAQAHQNPQERPIQATPQPLIAASAPLLALPHQAPGPAFAVGEEVAWSYVVTAITGTDLEPPVVSDDNATPADASDDWSPEPVLAGGFNVGDADTDGLLDAGESWYYATPNARRALAGSIGLVTTFSAEVSGPFTIATNGSVNDPAVATASDVAHHAMVDAGVELASVWCPGGVDATASLDSCGSIAPIDPTPPIDPNSGLCFSGIYQNSHDQLRRFDPLTSEFTDIGMPTGDTWNAMGYSRPLGSFYALSTDGGTHPQTTLVRIAIDGSYEAIGQPDGLPQGATTSRMSIPVRGSTCGWPAARSRTVRCGGSTCSPTLRSRWCSRRKQPRPSRLVTTSPSTTARCT